eukprot:Clim_evm49s218 gene=Clim_evmTU49s218
MTADDSKPAEEQPTQVADTASVASTTPTSAQPKPSSQSPPTPSSPTRSALERPPRIDVLFDPTMLKSPPASQVSKEDLAYERRQGAAYITDICRLMKMGEKPWLCAIFLYQRFYTLQSFAQCPKWQVIPSCIHIAGKCEYFYVSSKRICCAVDVVQRATSGNPSKGRHLQMHDPEMKDKVESMIVWERTVLKTLGYELTPMHVRRATYNVLRAIKAKKSLAALTFRYAHWSHCTGWIACYEPEVIGMAALLAALEDLDQDIEYDLWPIRDAFAQSVEEDEVRGIAKDLLSLKEFRNVAAKPNTILDGDNYLPENPVTSLNGENGGRKLNLSSSAPSPVGSVSAGRTTRKRAASGGNRDKGSVKKAATVVS